jgi:hypothetical protein
MRQLYMGRRMGDAGDELLAISVWDDLDSLVSAMGPEFERPTLLPALDAWVEDAMLEHFETTGMTSGRKVAGRGRRSREDLGASQWR